MDEEQKTILEEERNDYERSLEMLQKTLDGILSSLGEEQLKKTPDCVIKLTQKAENMV